MSVFCLLSHTIYKFLKNKSLLLQLSLAIFFDTFNHKIKIIIVLFKGQIESRYNAILMFRLLDRLVEKILNIWRKIP